MMLVMGSGRLKQQVLTVGMWSGGKFCWLQMGGHRRAMGTIVGGQCTASAGVIVCHRQRLGHP